MTPAPQSSMEIARDFCHVYAAEVLNEIGGVIGYTVPWGDEQEQAFAAALNTARASERERLIALLRRVGPTVTVAQMLIELDRALDTPAEGGSK